MSCLNVLLFSCYFWDHHPISLGCFHVFFSCVFSSYLNLKIYFHILSSYKVFPQSEFFCVLTNVRYLQKVYHTGCKNIVFSCVGLAMQLQFFPAVKAHFTLGTPIWFFTFVDSLMTLQGLGAWKFLITYGTCLWFMPDFIRYQLFRDLNFLWHLEQTNVSFIQIFSCFFKVFLDENFLSQLEQLYGFSPLWVLSCTFNVLRVELL